MTQERDADAAPRIGTSPRIDTSPPWRGGGARLLVVLVAAVALVAGGFMVGARLTSPVARSDDDQAAVAWSPVVQVSAETAPVLNGRVRGGRTYAVPAPLPPDASTRVVMAVGVRAGVTVRPGDVLAIVSGRPVVLVRTDFPFFRDLGPGDRGGDVRQLRDVLRADGLRLDRGDVFDQATQRALSQFYRRRGLAAVDGGRSAVARLQKARAELASLDHDASAAVVAARRRAVTAAELAAGARQPVGELVTMRQRSAVVASTAHPGDVLDDGDAVVTLRLGALQLVARADALTVPEYRKGQQVTVRLVGDGVSLKGQVVAVGPFVEGGGTEADFPGRDVTIAFDHPPKAALGVAGTVRASGRGSVTSPAVPLTALREAGGQRFVLRRNAEGRVSRLPVEVTGQADGYALLAPSALKVGDSVQVGP